MSTNIMYVYTISVYCLYANVYIEARHTTGCPAHNLISLCLSAHRTSVNTACINRNSQLL